MAISHRWITDDAFIDLRVVNNIVAGHGPVFNVGERVEAYTNPLWIIVLSIARFALPWVTTETAMVVLGIFFTTLGVIVGTLATVRFARPISLGLVVPTGAIVVASIDAMWWFSTSGLETGLLFGWLGLSWWALVRHLPAGGAQIYKTSAALFGLGVLIRPDAGFFSICFFASLLLIEGQRRRLSRGRAVALLVSFLAVPLASELFRIAYFGLLVPNTALAKSGFSLEPSQGLLYLEDFLHSSYLWIPGLILGVVLTSRLIRWWKYGLRLEAAIITIVACGAILDGLYVVAIGGDFMHARMFLPGFFLLSILSWLDLGEPLERRLPLTFLLTWSVVSLIFFRYPSIIINQYGITNERQVYIASSQNLNPVELTNYAKTWNFQHGHADQILANKLRHERLGGQIVSVCHCGLMGPGGWTTFETPARSPLPEVVFANAPSLGIWSVAAGPDVYIFDNFGLSNPIGSHFILTGHRTPGTADITDNTWMLARFAERAPAISKLTHVLAIERRAISCQPLSGYLRAIDAPLSWSTIWTNIEHSLTWTTMKFPSSPLAAERQLCH